MRRLLQWQLGRQQREGPSAHAQHTKAWCSELNQSAGGERCVS